ncbi:MAG: collagen-like protein [Bdellovibrionales bacterium]|nr:collagen-like protein [Bdellovibrionales bacterium]
MTKVFWGFWVLVFASQVSTAHAVSKKDLITKIEAKKAEIQAILDRLDHPVTGPKGPTGYPGPQGPRGPDGPVGAVGPMGLKGYKGWTGPMGPEGPAGVDAIVTGAVGPQGDVGPMGYQGPQGPKGPASRVRGPRGADGPQGYVGPVGPKGPTGPQGPPGQKGMRGYDGRSRGSGFIYFCRCVGSSTFDLERVSVSASGSVTDQYINRYSYSTYGSTAAARKACQAAMSGCGGTQGDES